MKLHVVYDNEGQIIALSAPLPPAYDFATPNSGAMASEGQQVADVELPDEFASMSLGDLSERLQVTLDGAPSLQARS
jgi:hypothetical protein